MARGDPAQLPVEVRAEGDAVAPAFPGAPVLVPAGDHAETAPGARIDRVAFLGFAEIGAAGVLDRGDELWIGGRRLGVLLGFDGCHLPNHYNVLVRAEPARTGTELGLVPGERLLFRQGPPAR